jgi:hypothetical protein
MDEVIETTTESMTDCVMRGFLQTFPLSFPARLDSRRRMIRLAQLQLDRCPALVGQHHVLEHAENTRV